ncbi:MAG: hypothetical protein ACREDJ_05680 [Methylocella sp.]
MIRMENYPHRHIERKMKLLIQLQRSRRKLERQLEEANQDNGIGRREDAAT